MMLILCFLQVHHKWLLPHRRSLRSVLPTVSSAPIVRTVNVARSSTSQPGTRALNVPTAESDMSRKLYRMLNRSVWHPYKCIKMLCVRPNTIIALNTLSASTFQKGNQPPPAFSANFTKFPTVPSTLKSN